MNKDGEQIFVPQFKNNELTLPPSFEYGDQLYSAAVPPEDSSPDDSQLNSQATSQPLRLQDVIYPFSYDRTVLVDLSQILKNMHNYVPIGRMIILKVLSNKELVFLKVTNKSPGYLPIIYPSDKVIDISKDIVFLRILDKDGRDTIAYQKVFRLDPGARKPFIGCENFTNYENINNEYNEVMNSIKGMIQTLTHLKSGNRVDTNHLEGITVEPITPPQAPTPTLSTPSPSTPTPSTPSPSTPPSTPTATPTLPSAPKIEWGMPLASGIYNYNNTCFFNAVVQLLYRIPEIHSLFSENSDTTKNNEMLSDLSVLFQSMKDQSSQIENEKIKGIVNKTCLIIPERESRRQEDAHEFLSHLFNLLPDSVKAVIALNVKGKYCPLLGYGVHQHTLKTKDGKEICDEKKIESSLENMIRINPIHFQQSIEKSIECDENTKTIDNEPFLMLNVTPSNKEYTLENIINSPDFMDNIRFAEYTNNQGNYYKCWPYIKVVESYETKKYIFVVLRIFKWDSLNKSQKIQHSIKDIDNITLDNKKYELIAHANHIGDSVDSGHYIAYIKGNDNVWYLYDDANRSQLTGSKDRGTPYILLYQLL